MAAGNDGLRGIAAQRRLSADTPEYLRLRIGPTGSKEVLVELWWDADTSSQLTVEAELSRAGQNLTPWPLVIDSTQTASLQVAGHAGSILCQSLFHAACYGRRSCIALALSVPHESGLRDVDIDLALTSTADVIVNAWLVVCSDARSAFITGGVAGSIMVPATDQGVIGVAGVTINGQPWAASSRGPTADYGTSSRSSTAPYLAHQVSAGLNAGTSFASPRACADAASLKRPGSRPTPWANAEEVAKDIVVASTHSLVKPWNARTGFGAVK